VERAYQAAVAGAFPEDERGTREPGGGRPASTAFRVERCLGAWATLVRCQLETGRTHQIRIHCGALGHPVLGDSQHGGPPPPGVPAPPRMALHATLLGFAHPRSGAPMRFESPLPPDLAAWLDALARAAGDAATGATPSRSTRG
jgi:23S rRNA pseudouridine1911/1915/1917 synthase